MLGDGVLAAVGEGRREGGFGQGGYIGVPPGRCQQGFPLRRGTMAGLGSLTRWFR